MKVILVGRKHAFALELQFPVSVARVEVSDSADRCDEISPEETEEVLKYDPRSTVNAHLERRSDMEDAYGQAMVKLQQDTNNARPFGFRSWQR